MKKLSLNDACTIAETRGGLCLSTEYKNNKTPLLWHCNKGHECLKEAKLIAHSRNGQCLSEKFEKSNKPLLWKCSRGHEWLASLCSIKNDSTWCPQCAHNYRLTLEHARQIAIKRNGVCLSENYINYAQQLARGKNGECLSEIFINSRLPMLWRCVNGHLWSAPFQSLKNCGSWCPFCRGRNKTIKDMHAFAERKDLCREIISKYLGPPSKIRRPNFLKTSEHPMGLELDIYYPEYGLAIEIQGVQHEKYIGFFHRGNPNNFIKQQERDQLKNELCEENWIVLRYV
ncbi:hypothetical protein Glove_319g194 [Diversispora epigaea]|uniref:Treble clef zinc finger domain-containing protein n=1 Tax=Diversispora epigaea TaxID=1348612 RepID=A0A397HU93_9GLOM|nr:hypothetical protein Glove_319g194 [Diversispora epigaea]